MKVILTTILVLMSVNAWGAEATYKVTMTNNWNLQDHLGVPGRAHFSPVVAASHNQDFDIYNQGGLTSAPLELVAELGRQGDLNAMVNRAVNAGSALELVNTPDMFLNQTQTQSFMVTVTEEHPFFSMVTMIAPSPDWFVGVTNMKLHDTESGFVTSIVNIPLFALDAGTESGDFGGNFSLGGAATSPHTPISVLTGNGFNAPFAFLTIELVAN